MSKAAAAASLPPPPPEVAHLVEQLQRNHLAPDASLLSNSAHADLLQVSSLAPLPRLPALAAAYPSLLLLQAREEVAAERALYLEALVSHPLPPARRICILGF